MREARMGVANTSTGGLLMRQFLNGMALYFVVFWVIHGLGYVFL